MGHEFQNWTFASNYEGEMGPIGAASEMVVHPPSPPMLDVYVYVFLYKYIYVCVSAGSPDGGSYRGRFQHGAPDTARSHGLFQ